MNLFIQKSLPCVKGGGAKRRRDCEKKRIKSVSRMAILTPKRKIGKEKRKKKYKKPKKVKLFFDLVLTL